MPRLSDLQASLLLQEIACAMRVGTPMDEAMRRLESRRLGAAARTAHFIADGVAQGKPVSAVLREIDHDVEHFRDHFGIKRRGRLVKE